MCVGVCEGVRVCGCVCIIVRFEQEVLACRAWGEGILNQESKKTNTGEYLNAWFLSEGGTLMRGTLTGLGCAKWVYGGRGCFYVSVCPTEQEESAWALPSVHLLELRFLNTSCHKSLKVESIFRKGRKGNINHLHFYLGLTQHNGNFFDHGSKGCRMPDCTTNNLPLLYLLQHALCWPAVILMKQWRGITSGSSLWSCPLGAPVLCHWCAKCRSTVLWIRGLLAVCLEEGDVGRD